MYTLPTKKLLMFDILDILQKKTDENHTLTQKEIEDILLKEYSMKADRKSIKRNLMNLRELGYGVEFNTKERKIIGNDTQKDEDGKVTSYTYSDFYLKREITDGELRFLIDAVYHTNYISPAHRKDLIHKLEDLSSIYFKDKLGYTENIQGGAGVKNQFFPIVEIIHKAISQEKKVSFYYCDYGVDKKLHERCNADGTKKLYVVSPYQMLLKDGKYLLLGNCDENNQLETYCVDRIKQIEKLDDSYVKPLEQKHMKDDSIIHAKFRIPKSMINNVFDVFGCDIRFVDETETEVTVWTDVNEEVMLRYAKCFAPDVVLLGPEKLVKHVKKDIEKTSALYR